MNAVYVRVSTDDQSTEAQESALRAWLTANGFADVVWYRDVGSGKNLERESMARLKADIFSGKVKTVVVWKIDRLSRNLRDGINLLHDWLEKGVRVISTTQQLDLSGPVGRLMAALLLGLAEIEREYIRERQALGISLARERGVYKGRRCGATKSVPTRARELAARGAQRDEIAGLLGVSRRTVYRYLNTKG